MANIIQYRFQGKEAYPRTITNAIADKLVGKTLSDIIQDLIAKDKAVETLASGIKMVRLSENEYQLVNNRNQALGDKVKINDTYIKDIVCLSSYTNASGQLVNEPVLKFSFNIESQKQDIYVSIKTIRDEIVHTILTGESNEIKLLATTEQYFTEEEKAIIRQNLGITEVVSAKIDAEDSENLVLNNI